MIRARIIFICLSLTSVLGACDYLFQEKSNDQVIARVYDNYLRESQVRPHIPSHLKGVDSVDFVQTFIRNWATNQLVLHRAELNLLEDELDLEARVRDYRNALLRHSYEEKVLSNQLDTTIEESELATFYQENQELFTLTEDIVRSSYAVFNAEAPESKKVLDWFKENNWSEVRTEVEDYCFQYATDFQLSDSLWVSLDNLKRNLSIQYSGSNSRFLRYHKLYEQKNDQQWVLVRFHEYILAGNIAPLAYVREEIKGIIINQRKMQVLKQMAQDLYEDALRKNHLEISK